MRAASSHAANASEIASCRPARTGMLHMADMRLAICLALRAGEGSGWRRPVVKYVNGRNGGRRRLAPSHCPPQARKFRGFLLHSS